MRLSKTITTWLMSYSGTMVLVSSAFAAPTVSVQDVVTFPGSFFIETLIEGNQGEIFGLIGKPQPIPNSLAIAEQSLFKIDAQGQYREVLAFTEDRVLSFVKGADNRLYLLVQKPDSYKLYRFDISRTSPQLELVYDFGPRELARICPVNNTAPEYLYQKTDGVFVVAFRHDAGLMEDLGQCAYGTATLDLSGSAPVYKPIYETVPNVSFDYGNFLKVSALFEQQGKFYTLFYRGGTGNFSSVGYHFQQIDPAKNPPQENIIADSVGSYRSDSVLLSVLRAANNKFYGLKNTFHTNIDGTGSLNSVLFEIDPANNPVFNAVKTFTSSISFNDVYQVVYSQDFPNALGDFIKADRLGNYFFGTHNAGLAEGKLLFRLDNTGSTPVYYEYPDVRIPLQFSNLTLFANNAFYGENRVSQTGSEGNLESVLKLVKVEVTGVDLLQPANTAPVAVADAFKLFQKGKKSVIIAAPGLLKNDSDAEGDKLSIVGIAPGKPKVIPVSGKNGKIEVYSDGRMVYTPSKGKAPHVITFSYQATDGRTVSNGAIVTLKIKTDHEWAGK